MKHEAEGLGKCEGKKLENRLALEKERKTKKSSTEQENTARKATIQTLLQVLGEAGSLLTY